MENYGGFDGENYEEFLGKLKLFIVTASFFNRMLNLLWLGGTNWEVLIEEKLELIEKGLN